MLAIRYLLWMLWFITNCDILGGEPFLGPSSFLCPIEKIWRIDCHNFPTKGTNINQYFRVNNRQDWWFEQRKKIIVEILQKKKHFNALHLSLYWTSCHKSHLNSKERGHKDKNWKATHPTSCPKVPKCSKVPKIAQVLLEEKMFRLLVGCWRPTSNWGPPSHPQATPLLSLPPPSASLIHGLYMATYFSSNTWNEITVTINPDLNCSLPPTCIVLSLCAPALIKIVFVVPNM